MQTFRKLPTMLPKMKSNTIKKTCMQRCSPVVEAGNPVTQRVILSRPSPQGNR